MRDVRQKEDYDGRVRPMASEGDGVDEEEVLNGRRIVYPQEALRIAQEMRCDRYCECSALTGEVSEISRKTSLYDGRADCYTALPGGIRRYCEDCSHDYHCQRG